MNTIAVGGHSSQNSIGVLGFAAGGDAPTITVVTRSLSDSLSMSDTITVRVTRARSLTDSVSLSDSVTKTRNVPMAVH